MADERGKGNRVILEEYKKQLKEVLANRKLLTYGYTTEEASYADGYSDALERVIDELEKVAA